MYRYDQTTYQSYRFEPKVCFICSGEEYYKDNNGEWHKCPKCSGPYMWTPIVTCTTQ